VPGVSGIGERIMPRWISTDDDCQVNRSRLLWPSEIDTDERVLSEAVRALPCMPPGQGRGHSITFWPN